MKKLLLTFAMIVAVAASAFGGAISGAGNIGCDGNPFTGTVWNSSTGLNSTQILLGPTPFPGVTVVLDQTTTITAGAVTFQADYGDGNFVTVPSYLVVNPATFATIANPYTLVASTNQVFWIPLLGVNRLQLKLTTSLTGTGSMTPYVTGSCVVFPFANSPHNLTQVGGTAVDSNSGSKSGGTQRVVIATDQPALSNKLLVTPDAVALPAGSALIGETVQSATATTTNGVLGCYLVSAASTNATSCKGSSGNFYGFWMVNTTATLYYLRLYNTAAAPTCSSATGFIQSIPIPASATGAGIVVVLPVGLGYSTGIGFCFTGGASSTDNTNAATGVFGAVLYK